MDKVESRKGGAEEAQSVLASEGENQNMYYAAQLAACTATLPICTRLLARAEENRTIRLARLAPGARLRGLEELLGLLESYELGYAGNGALSKLSFLIARTRAHFAVGLEASLSGLHSVVHDAMRGVMEIEFLLRDFTHAPEHVDEWLTWSERDRRKKFDPVHLRERHAKTLGKRPGELPEASDYKAHSHMLHVSPRRHPLGSFGIVDDGADPDSWGSDVCFWEMYEHARRLLQAAYDFAKDVAPSIELSSPDEAAKFRDGWERTNTWKTIVIALARASKERGNEGESG